MVVEDELDITTIENLSAAISNQKAKIEEIRKKNTSLEFVSVDPVGHYSSVTYKAIDGGVMNINFDPLEVDYVVIADSNENILQKFVVPKGWKLSSDDFKFLNEIQEVAHLLELLKLTKVKELSEVLNDPKTAMEIAEYSCIFERINSHPKGDKIIVMRDGLLRTKKIKSRWGLEAGVPGVGKVKYEREKE